MFNLTDVPFLNGCYARFQTLKPWWDVLMEYLVLVMLMISLLAGTMLISVDDMTCLPLNYKINETTIAVPNPRTTDSTTKFSTTKSDHSTELDYQQYLYISHACYEKVLPLFSRYFPYLALVNSLLLMASGNFWFSYPKTSSKIEHFLAILMKCFESPWTTKALSEMSCQYFLALPRTTGTVKCKEQLISPSSSPILDWKDREQGQALFEKIHKFRSHMESASLIYTVYMGQTIFKAVMILVILGYSSNYVGSISSTHVCWLDTEKLTGYSTFLCTHSLAFILKKLITTYLFLVFLHGIVGAYPLLWLFQKSLKKYSFKQVQEDGHFLDIPDVHNDFAFLLHMSDQCDQLYSWRFAMFLSAMGKSYLLDVEHDLVLEDLQ